MNAREKTFECKDKYSVYEQNKIKFLVNYDRAESTRLFYNTHGASIASIGLVVECAKTAVSVAKDLGFDLLQPSSNVYHLYGVEPMAGCQLFFVDHNTVRENNLFYLATHSHQDAPLIDIDHIAINVCVGSSLKWIDQFKTLLGMQALKQFHIHGTYTQFTSQALINADKTLRIVINESVDEQSQISEYLRQHGGEGVQHLAFTTEDICRSVELLELNNIRFMEIPDKYYELIDKRLPNHHQDIEQLRQARVLIDGDHYQENQILLQIFTHALLGPIFFELIQRKGDQGFGAGNIKALYESVERDQVARGVLNNAG